MAPTTMDSQPDQSPAYITLDGHRYPFTNDPKEALDEFRAFSDNEKTMFVVGIARAISDVEVTKALEDTAKESAAAIATIDALFVSVSSSLHALPYGQEEFLKDFENIKQTYRGTVDDSRVLAIETSVYARNFDLVVIAYCADSSVSIDERKARIQKYIEDAAGIERKAEEMSLRFQRLKDTFAAFTGTFSSWADKQEGEINAQLKVLRDDIQALQAKIDKIDAEIAVLQKEIEAHKVANAAWWFFLSVFAGALAMSIAARKAAVRADRMVGLVASKIPLREDLRAKEEQVNAIRPGLSTIQDVRIKLVAQGNLDSEIFSKNVTYMQELFTRTRNSALEIQYWLRLGAEWADVPDVVEVYVNEGVRLYTGLAKYLTDYANGVVTVQKSFQ